MDNIISNFDYKKFSIKRFSDDGVTFFGAYGPKIITQTSYVVDTIIKVCAWFYDWNFIKRSVNLDMDSPVFILTIPLIVISLLSIRKLIKEKNKSGKPWIRIEEVKKNEQSS